MLLGVQVLGRVPLGLIKLAAASGVAYAVAAASGFGTGQAIAQAGLSAVATATGYSSAQAYVTTGSDRQALALGFGTAQAFAETSYSGITASAAGRGTAQAYAVSYTFVFGGEIACVPDEDRTWVMGPKPEVVKQPPARVSAEKRVEAVAFEPRLAIVRGEDRVYDRGDEDTAGGTYNRKRDC